MIVEYDNNGSIIHIINDPVPEGLADIMRQNGAVLLDLPPVKRPDNQLIENGVPIFEEDGVTPVMVSNGYDMADVDFMRDYVDTVAKEIKNRPLISAPSKITLNVGDNYTLSGLPDPIDVRIDEEITKVEGGVLELEGEMPGTYLIRLEGFPYIEKMIELTVNEN